MTIANCILTALITELNWAGFLSEVWQVAYDRLRGIEDELEEAKDDLESFQESLLNCERGEQQMNRDEVKDAKQTIVKLEAIRVPLMKVFNALEKAKIAAANLN